MSKAGLIAAFVFGCAACKAEAQDRPSTLPPSPVHVPEPLAPLPPPSQPSKARPAIPLGNPGNWVSVSDYPAAALQERKEGVTGFRLIIGPDGRSVSCIITSSSGSPDLDQATCAQIMRRAIFRPALDAEGEPTEGSFSNRVRWVIPPSAQKFRPSERIMSFIVEVDGRVTQCAELIDGKPVEGAASPTPCSTGTKMNAFTDSSGKPVRKKVMITHSVKVIDFPE